MAQNMDGDVTEDDLVAQEAREAKAEAYRTLYKKCTRKEDLGESPREMYYPVLKDDLAVLPDILASCLRKVETFVREKFGTYNRCFK